MQKARDFLFVLSLMLVAVGVTETASRAADKLVKVGQLAPDFSLVDQSGTTHTLSAYRGHWVVLYFYPKDDTPGCTKEACRFRDDYAQVKQLGADVLGVSVDNTDSHAKFAAKYHLPFPLLADHDGKVARSYNSLFGIWPIRFARRHTFIIDPQGRIAKIYRDVDPATHSAVVIGDLKALQATR